MPVGYTTVSALYLQDATGTPIDNATISFTPVSSVTGIPLSFRTGGNGGATSYVAVSALVSAGQFSVQLADTAMTWPVDIGYAVTVVDNTTGNSLLGPGYGCIQPTGATWSLDTYEPNLGTLVTVQTGPQGLPGIPGGVAGTMFDVAPTGTVDGTNVTFTLPASPSILIITKNGIRQTLGTDYTLTGTTVTFLPIAVPAPGDVLWATGITPAPVTTTGTTTTASGPVTSIQLVDSLDGNTYTFVSKNGQLSPA